MRSILLLLAGVLFAGPLQASDQGALDRILAQKTPPFGVVFEILEGDDDALRWAIPEVKRQAEALRARFPEIPIALVSHGREEFALKTSMQEDFPAVHEGVRSLVGSEVAVHVCGTHASWFGDTPEDFPDYVDVSPAGPAQIRDYRALGYELIRVREP